MQVSDVSFVFSFTIFAELDEAPGLNSVARLT